MKTKKASQKWTPEPINKLIGVVDLIIHAFDEADATNVLEFVDKDLRKARANVNLLAGIENPKAVRELIATAKEVVSNGHIMTVNERRKLCTALAKLDGKDA